VPAILLAGVLGGMVWAGLTALLRDKFNANEILVSLMLVYVANLLLNWLVFGPWKDPKGFNFPQSVSFADGAAMVSFLLLPVVIGVVAGLGSSTRWYRTIFLDEMAREYVRTARAKGLSEMRVLFGHVLRNAMIPILTGVVVVIPSLFLGSLLFESFFGIPGLGSYTIDAINAQDFGVVRAMVFLGSVLYILGLVLTDLSYAWVDPRVRFS
jgi:peptide/nickel transport system permease protein